VCLDTCHLFATGYGLDTPAGVDSLLEELRASGVLPRVALLHANDSTFGRGERRDRHADVGDGPLHWAALTASPLAGVPWILETAGDEARQRRDIALLRGLGERR
jgi:deoxyribonuclease-4